MPYFLVFQDFLRLCVIAWVLYVLCRLVVMMFRATTTTEPVRWTVPVTVAIPARRYPRTVTMTVAGVWNGHGYLHSYEQEIWWPLS